jgi:hypothetical protein
MLTKGLDKRGFTNPGHTRDANTNAVPGMGQKIL